MFDVPDPQRTRELLARYREGEHTAEIALFERHRDELLERARGHRLMPVLSWIGTEEDFVDECFVRALQDGRLAGFEDRGEGSLGGWLGMILDRVFLDAARRASAEKRGGGRRPERIDATDAPTLNDADRATPTSDARVAELLELCARVLTPDDFQLWRRIELQGSTSEAVAREIGATSAAVRSRLRRIRSRLVRELTPPSESP